MKKGREGMYRGATSLAVRARHATWMLAFAIAATVAGCSQNKQSDQDAEPVPVTRLKVQNQAFLDMTIYVYRGPQRLRLGTANGNSTSRFTIPASLIFGATPLRFQADPIGSNRNSISEEITVSPGDEVTLLIPPQ